MSSDEQKRLGKYELLKKIGSGGMAEIFLARQAGIEGFEKLLVIKRIHPSLTQGTEALRFQTMFLDEARLAARLNHPNVVQIYDLGRVDEQLFIAMEYVNGVDLSRLLTRVRCRDQTVPVAHAVKILTYVCEALTYAHALKDSAGSPLGLVHRDVSPQNVLLSFDGGVKLTDFGIAKATARAAQTRVGKVKGKMSYMSPEQVRGRDLDHRSDLFNVGILLYELTTGERPFGGSGHQQIFEAIAYKEPPPPALLRPDLPPDLVPILNKALAKDPDARFQDALALQLALEHFMVSAGLVSNATVIGNYLRGLFEEIVAAQLSGPEGKRAISLEGILSSRELMLQLEEVTENRVTPSERPGTRSRPEVDAADPHTAVTAPGIEDAGRPTLQEPVQPDGAPTFRELKPGGAAPTVPEGAPDLHSVPTTPDLHGAPTTPDAAPASSAAMERRPSFMLERVSGSGLPAAEAAAPTVPMVGGGPTERLEVTSPERPRALARGPASRSSGGRGALLAGLVALLALAALGVWLLQRAPTAGAAADAGAGAVVVAASAVDAGGRDQAATQPDPTPTPSSRPEGAGHGEVRVPDSRPPSRGHDSDDAPPPPPPPVEISPELEAWLQGDAPEPREIGRLTLRATPPAEVWLGYNHLGETPLVEMKLPAGRFPLRLRSRRAGIEKAIVVEIRADHTTTLSIDLRR